MCTVAADYGKVLEVGTLTGCMKTNIEDCWQRHQRRHQDLRTRGASGVATFKTGVRPPHPSPQMNVHVGLRGRHWRALATDFEQRGTGPHVPIWNRL